VAPPPPPLGQTGPTSEFKVTILSERNEMVMKLELYASGEIFFESLKPVMKKMRRELDRSVDFVRFSPHKDVIENCCWVNLKEDQVADEWENAVDWFNCLKAHTKVYAVIGRDDDD
jgi:hypothetical protein